MVALLEFKSGAWGKKLQFKRAERTLIKEVDYCSEIF
jgi:hypothetical protein